MTAHAQIKVVGALGAAQTLAWASSYYLPAVLAAPMAAHLAIPTSTVYAAFSVALMASALVGPWTGRAIDHQGGRRVLVGGSLLFSGGLIMLAFAQGVWMVFASWLIIGVAMGAGLYEAAFSCLVGLYGRSARSAITGITLIAGFASTIGWPVSAWMETQFGWRGACLGWAVAHLLIGLPLNAWLPQGGDTARTETQDVDDPPEAVEPAAPRPARPVATAAVLALVFAAASFITTAMATHFPRILVALGAAPAAAIAIGTLIGPAQVAARVIEFSLRHRIHPMWSARAATLAHPIGAVLLLVTVPAVAPLFAILHGAGNGILTIVKGTLPLALFGAQGFGALQGWLMLPARIAQALSPLLFGLALDAWGANALWLSSAIGLVAFGALLPLRRIAAGRAR